MLVFVYDVNMSSDKLFAKKSLGQHFLHSPSALKKIIDAANLKTDETVLEIGPGTGILTEALLKSGAKVVAVEKDARSIELLKEKFASFIENRTLTLISGDILEMTAELEDNKYALVANIPYYITGAILEKFLQYEPRPNRAVILVQKEVAERIVARDGKESILSISVKAFGTPKIVAIVPRGAFVPPPNVDSAILEIDNISDQQFGLSNIQRLASKHQEVRPVNGSITRFFEVLKAGFAHKRKYAIRNIEAIFNSNNGIANGEKSNKEGAEKLIKIWEEIGLNEKIRAEEINTSQWIKIAELL